MDHDTENTPLLSNSGAGPPDGMATALISFLNLVCLYVRRKAMPLVLNLVIDPIVIFYSFGWSVTGLVENSPWCEPECDGTSKWIQLLAGIGLSFALGLG
ncbi:hypothetical protein I7I51_08309 [Histoplasma capsulatum]|uniref:Uncharacterized protein n=1 Tax=Ajellomyces capsulatus TaxID=5037 RepID=A0A8A1LYB1_AJECA|nr:hypothetical protein I7I51_08309 [Histoplasma capsulatum]